MADSIVAFTVPDVFRPYLTSLIVTRISPGRISPSSPRATASIVAGSLRSRRALSRSAVVVALDLFEIAQRPTE